MLKRIILAAVVLLASQLAYSYERCDVNGDDVVNAADVTALYNWILNNDASALVNGDVNGDGVINAGDVTTVYNKILNGIDPVVIPERLVGGDISMLTKYEEGGAIYNDKDGNKIDNVLAFFKQQGWNAMRVRLFVKPQNASEEDKKEGVVQDLNYVKALGKRIKDAGFVFVLDLHYSDTWADPGAQSTPAAWRNASVEALKDSVYNYTRSVMQAMQAAGATPDMIQLGNEITGGMLWPTGQVYAAGGAPEGGSWTNFAAYQKRAAQAVHEVSSGTKIILHVEMHNWTMPGDFFTNCVKEGVEFDVMGLSYYAPYHGTFYMLNNCLARMEAASDKPIMIMEAAHGYAWALPGSNNNDYNTWLTNNGYSYSNEGQKKFTVDMIAALKQHSCVKGLFWWWPEANENGIDWHYQVTSSWWNGSLFDNRDGKAQLALYELKTFLE